jgi:MoaA/NifB/PqqE/SkfB family radical SAM enzyme
MCKTCGIWRLYRDDRSKFHDELSLGEIERIFESMGEVYFFNISGGEPFLRQDLPEIVAAACKHLKPAVIHTPTNALSPRLIEDGVAEILEIIRASGRIVPFTVKPSFDGVGEAHDEIRGVPGNFEKVLETLLRLRKLEERYPNLEVGLGTIISKFNLSRIGETARFARRLGVSSYISEIAEERSELFNIGEPITPTAVEYEKAIGEFNLELMQGGVKGERVSGVTLALRQVYYRYAIRILKEKRQVLPCYAGIANVHISPYGDVWPCCILGYGQPMGSLRDADYDFMRVWHSPQADEVRRFIIEGRCYCPLANQAYSNILFNARAMLGVIRELAVSYQLRSRKPSTKGVKD